MSRCLTAQADAPLMLLYSGPMEQLRSLSRAQCMPGSAGRMPPSAQVPGTRRCSARFAAVGAGSAAGQRGGAAEAGRCALWRTGHAPQLGPLSQGNPLAVVRKSSLTGAGSEECWQQALAEEAAAGVRWQPRLHCAPACSSSAWRWCGLAAVPCPRGHSSCAHAGVHAGSQAGLGPGAVQPGPYAPVWLWPAAGKRLPT